MLFQRHRARKVMEALATQSGWRFVKRIREFYKKNDLEMAASETMHKVFSTRRVMEETHLWVCLEDET